MAEESKTELAQWTSFDEMVPVIDRAMANAFPTFAKLVQAEVGKYIVLRGIEEGVVDARYTELFNKVNEVAIVIGKEIERNVVKDFAERKGELNL